MTAGEDTAAAPAKVDPETLVLRGRPGRVTRFRRSVVIGLVGFGAMTIAGATWLAFQPASIRMAVGEEDRGHAGKAVADVLADAPKSYGEVPKLGPALPGDLGRPILAHQRAIGVDLPAVQPDLAAQAAEAERQRVAAERRAARESAIMMKIGGVSPDLSAAQEPAASSLVPPPPAGDPVDVGRNPGWPDRKREFLAAAGPSPEVTQSRLVAPVSPWTLSAGSVIAASLITGINSDLPGLVSAQVTEHVFDSASGRVLLVPQGARLIGSYDSVIAFGQERALLVWQRLILPDGSSLRLDNAPAADPAGYAGLSGKVDFHTWRLLKGVAIATLLGVSTELPFSGESDLVEALRESTQGNAARAGDQITRRNLDIPPTIRIRPGTPVRLVVHRDLALAPWQDAGR